MVSQILLLSHPRTACHLFERMLSQQPNVCYLSHPFAAARPAQLRSLSDPLKAKLPGDVTSALVKGWEEGLATWETEIEKARTSNQILFTHTHPNFITAPDLAFQYIIGRQISAETKHNWPIRNKQETTNTTVLPDDFFLHPGTIPVFTIRHPALMIPSIYRAMTTVEFDNFQESSNIIASANLGWSRLLYDWYAVKGVEPIVADADDYMTSQEFMRQLCNEIGFSPDHLIFTWPKASEDELGKIPPFVAEIKKTILGSDGIIPGMDARGLKLEEEEQKWRDEFGARTATFLKELVDKAVPHYEYLRERRFRVKDEHSLLCK